jgi:transcriptional regulator with XRE-family HTH domain
MSGRPQQKQTPLFGQRLAGARNAKGWSQTELAHKLNTTLKMIDYYERRAVNPSVEFVRRAAQVLGVSMTELIGENKQLKAHSKPGPSSQLEQRMEKIRRLPRKEQEFVLRFLDTVLERYNRAS